MAKFGTTSEGARRHARCHFWDSSVSNEHFGVLQIIKNQSAANLGTHMSKQNHQNNVAKHVRICTLQISMKIDTRKLMKKDAVSKMNENPRTKMRIMLPTLRRKTKLLKYNYFLRHFWSL